MADPTIPDGTPDLRQGVRLEDLAAETPLLGTVDGEPVLLVRHEDGVTAIGGRCTHWGAPLWEGLASDGILRCPWHHACFSTREGEVRRPPALTSLPRWDVVEREGVVRVVGAGAPVARAPVGPLRNVPDSVVLVGAGAAGIAAARTLREEGYDGPVTLVDPDADAPYDRPNLSKDYLAGTAPEEWLPLTSEEELADRRIDRRFTAVERIDPGTREVTLSGDERLRYGALLLAPGSSAASLPVPGVELPHVHTLRSFADCRRIVAALTAAREVVVVGAGFLGMEAAAAIRARGPEVTVVAPERVPFERLLGPELGEALRVRLEAAGVAFELERGLSVVEPEEVVLDDGRRLPADLVLIAVGARPETRLAENGGLRVDDGILVDASMATSAPGVWAAGDVARFPDPLSGGSARIEHWTVALAQGQVAARAMLGQSARYAVPPFFWTRLAGASLTYAGHVERWDDLHLDGDPGRGEALAQYRVDGETRAIAALGRSKESLAWDARLERRWTEATRAAPEGPDAAATP